MKPRTYQLKAARFLGSRRSGGLVVDMGLGKTLSTLLELVDRFPQQTLVVGPKRVVETVWAQEAEKWGLEFSFSLVLGSPPEREAALRRDADIYLTNFENMIWVLERKSDFHTLVVDESSKFKNPESVRFQALRHYLRKFRSRIILTGTPTPNSLLEIWSQIFILDGGERLGVSYGMFRDRFFTYSFEKGQWFPKQTAKEKIYRLISDIVFRVDRRESPREVPPITYNVLRVPLGPKARRAYEEMENEAFTSWEDATISVAAAIASLTKCRQIANGVVYTDDGSARVIHKEKLSTCLEVIEEVKSPLIIAYQYRHEKEVLLKILKRFGVCLPTPENIVRWNKGQVPILLLHPQSGGHGLNLQFGGHDLLWFGLSFSYEQFAQTEKRIHDRIGQENPVTVHILEAVDTIDEVMLRVVRAKAEGQADLLDYLYEYKKRKKPAKRIYF
jgi:SNF2 family DNA or RNA helicase